MAFYAREFKVEYHALRRRLRDIPSRIDRDPINKKLTEDKELIIIRYIKLLKDFSIILRPRFVRGITNSMFKGNHLILIILLITVNIN
jgi:hypothetical protein